MKNMIDPVSAYLFNQGANAYAYRDLGCHRHADGSWQFVVWAPHATAVSVLGDFNQWSPDTHQMEVFEETGLWQITISHLENGDLYKYYISDAEGQSYYRADPFAFYSELRPGTASRVWDLSGYHWYDKSWMNKRKKTSTYDKPVSIYEVHIGSWCEKNNYQSIAMELAAYVNKMGYTHVELMPLSEYPLDMSWGYQVTGYFSATARYGTPQDLMEMVDILHQHDIGVLLDWVPAHFPRDDHGLRNFDGQACFEYADTRLANTEWGTLQFDFGRGEVQSFLQSNAVFWLDYFHIDGLRVDAVSSMLYTNYCKEYQQPIYNKLGNYWNLEGVDFLKKLNAIITRDFPNVLFCAEEATTFPDVTKSVDDGGLGFTYKWNMGWMHDSLKYMQLESLARKHHQQLLTFPMVYAFHEHYILPISHDEVVHGKKSLLDKMSGIYEEKFSNMRAFYAYQYACPGKKLVFMGIEIGQFIEWRYNEPLEWQLLKYDKHRDLQTCVQTINHFYREHSAMYQNDENWDGFQWLSLEDNESSVIAFARISEEIPKEIIVCVFNFTPVTRKNYRIGVPVSGLYTECLNTDAASFGGDDIKNERPIRSERVQSEECQHSICLTLPGLSAVYLKHSLTTKKLKKWIGNKIKTRLI